MAIKPTSISHIDAASLQTAVGAIQCFKYALSHLPPGMNLEGKTVFVPGALSGTRSVGCQIAKKRVWCKSNHYCINQEGPSGRWIPGKRMR